MKYVLPVLCALLFVGAGCATSSASDAQKDSNPKAYHVLANDGYEDVELKGVAWLGCSEDDAVLNSYNFEATKNGNRVTGTVCCGLLFKGCTIRL